MMHDFLEEHSKELLDRCRAKVALRPARDATAAQLKNGVPLFLSQLIRTLQAETSDHPNQSRDISGTTGGLAGHSEMGLSAALHGRELLGLGFTVDQVVHDYGDLCQAITDLAYERDIPFRVDEFRTLNRCLDNAIAEAVTEFSYQRDFLDASRNQDEKQRHASFVHELRNHLNTAALALNALKSGNLGLSGATGAVLARSIASLRTLVTDSLDDIGAARQGLPKTRLIPVADFISEMEATAALTAEAQGCLLLVSPVDPALAINADKDLLTGALGNLLLNAFKFTEPKTQVSLETYAIGDRVLIDVKDHCGGLPPGISERIFMPFVKASKDRSGLGLGLSIAKHSVELCGGTLSVRNVPGSGCVFTIDLPRHAFDPAFPEI